MARDLRGLLRGRKIDAAVLEDLETRLLSADVGVEATTEILADLNRRVARHELDDVEALLDALRDRLTEMLSPCERPLQIEPGAKPFVVLVVGVNGSGKTTSIGKLAQRAARAGPLGDAGRRRHFPCRRGRAAARSGPSVPAHCSARSRPGPTRAR